MKHQEKGSKQEAVEESLIPAVREEEQRLQAMLDEARAEASRMESVAESEAAERVDSAKSELAGDLSADVDERLVGIRSEEGPRRESEDRELSVLERRGRGNVEAAVRHVVELVLRAGGRQ